MSYPYATLLRFRQAVLRTVLPCTVLLLVLTGCDSGGLVESDFTADTALAKGGPEPAQPVKLFSDPNQIVGESTINRTENGISFRINTTGLTPGHVVTVWTVIFNHPEYCVDGCDGADFANPLVQADAVWGAGRIIGETGSATFAGRQAVGANQGSFFPGYLGLPSPGLLDAENAEIHFVLRSHGPKIPALASEMMHTYNAGCGPVFNGKPVPESLGTYGPNTCQHLQFAIHEVTTPA